MSVVLMPAKSGEIIGRFQHGFYDTTVLDSVDNHLKMNVYDKFFENESIKAFRDDSNNQKKQPSYFIFKSTLFAKIGR